MPNRLIDLSQPAGFVSPVANQTQENGMSEEKKPRAYFYHQDCPQGQVFEGQEAIDNAKDSGWQDTPLPVKQVAQDEQSDVTQDDVDGLVSRLDQLDKALVAATERAETAEQELERVKQAVASLKSTAKDVIELKAAFEDTANESD